MSILQCSGSIAISTQLNSARKSDSRAYEIDDYAYNRYDWTIQEGKKDVRQEKVLIEQENQEEGMQEEQKYYHLSRTINILPWCGWSDECVSDIENLI